jgi:hypothetical protein
MRFGARTAMRLWWLWTPALEEIIFKMCAVVCLHYELVEATENRLKNNKTTRFSVVFPPHAPQPIKRSRRN